MKKFLRISSPLLINLALQSISFAVSSINGLTEEALPFERSPIITIGYLVQLFFSLLIVFGLIYLTAKYVLPKLQVSTKGRLIEVVDRVGLEPQVSAYIIKVGNRSFLLAVSGKNVQLISEIQESGES